VAVKAWEALSEFTGRDHSHLALPKDEKIRFRDIQAQPRKIISSPDLVGPGRRTRQLQRRLHQRARADPMAHLTGRQQFYQDHPWMRPSARVHELPAAGQHPHGRDVKGKRERQTEIVLNFITPHQKWGIHSTYSDNLLMLTLSRGGPIVWLSGGRRQARRHRGQRLDRAVQRQRRAAARAVVSQRVKPGMVMMYHAQERS
jgi:nitrate reductase alpha subunit